MPGSITFSLCTSLHTMFLEAILVRDVKTKEWFVNAFHEMLFLSKNVAVMGNC